jgi:hypothetical protein
MEQHKKLLTAPTTLYTGLSNQGKATSRKSGTVFVIVKYFRCAYLVTFVEPFKENPAPRLPLTDDNDAFSTRRPHV